MVTLSMWWSRPSGSWRLDTCTPTQSRQRSSAQGIVRTLSRSRPWSTTHGSVRRNSGVVAAAAAAATTAATAAEAASVFLGRSPRSQCRARTKDKKRWRHDRRPHTGGSWRARMCWSRANLQAAAAAAEGRQRTGARCPRQKRPACRSHRSQRQRDTGRTKRPLRRHRKYRRSRKCTVRSRGRLSRPPIRTGGHSRYSQSRGYRR
eukprot:1036353-Pleurochrysis_carterae.AAC.1